MKQFYATRNFNDAGTGRAFNVGQLVDVSEGELANYQAAGLVTDEQPTLELSGSPVVSSDED